MMGILEGRCQRHLHSSLSFKSKGRWPGVSVPMSFPEDQVLPPCFPPTPQELPQDQSWVPSARTARGRSQGSGCGLCTHFQVQMSRGPRQAARRAGNQHPRAA